MKMNSVFNKFIIGIWVVFCFVIYLTFLLPIVKAEDGFILPNWCVFVISLIILSFFICLVKYIKKKTTESVFALSANGENVVLVSVTLLLFLFQVVLIYMIAFRTGWDPGAVQYGANYAALKDTEGMRTMAAYFSYYPNNLFLTFIYASIYKMNYSLGALVSNNALLPLFMQAAISSVTAILTYKCARRFLSVSYSWIVYLLYVVLAGTSPWLVIAYSDSTGLIFPILVFYCYLKYNEAKSKQWIWIALMGIAAIIGFEIKPMALIVLIAIVIIELLYFFEENRPVKSLIIFVAILLIAGVFSLGACKLCINSMGYELDEEKAYGLSHWFMMGLNDETNGGYYQEDFDFSDGFATRATRNEANIERAKERIFDYGVGGLLAHGFKKMTHEYTDGTFGWVADKSFFEEIYPERDNHLSPLLRDLYYGSWYSGSRLYDYQAIIREMVWIIVLLGIFGIVIFKPADRMRQVLILSIEGLMIYLLFFEAHPRYIFTFIPLFVLAFGCGIRSLIDGDVKMNIGRRIIRKICYRCGKIIPDKLYIKMMYFVKLGEKCNLKNPQTFDEKLNYLKLYDRNPQYSMLADKYRVREYIADIIGEEYLIPILGVWDDPQDIPFDALPEQFVLKCNHDSASVIICKDKSGKDGNPFDHQAAIKKLTESMNTNYFYASREWPYKDIKPMVIAEQYMEDESGTELKDYKIYCFNGKPHLIQVDFGRFVHHERNLYDTEWKYIDKQIEYPKNSEHQIAKPASLEEMLRLAQKLAEDINSPSIRIDFYDINGKVYFGEITFYQEGGFAKFEPKEYGLELGEAIKLNMV